MLNNAEDQFSEVRNRCRARREVVDDQILNVFRLNERTKRFIFAERVEKLHNRIGGFRIDDEILFGDEEISDLSGVAFLISRKSVDGGFELRRSEGGEDGEKQKFELKFRNLTVEIIRSK